MSMSAAPRYCYIHTYRHGRAHRVQTPATPLVTN